MLFTRNRSEPESSPAPPKVIETDEQALDEAAKLQEKSKEATLRMQQKLHETEALGAMTLDDLYERRRQLEGIEQQGYRLDNTLEETKELQTKLGSIFSTMFQPPSIGKSSAPLPDEPSTIFKKGRNEDGTRRWRLRSPKKKNMQSDKAGLFPQGGLIPEDTNAIPPEQYRQMRNLQTADEELDDQLDEIGMQLETICRMADEIGAEAYDQGKQIRRVNHQLTGVEVKQQEVNEKTSRLLADGTGTDPSSGGKMFKFTPW